MSTIWRRLKYYGIGFGIGCIFVFFFFQNRGCSWLPSNRVKNSILDRLIVVSDSTESILKEKGISHDALIQVLNDGEVYFGESDKDDDDKVYVLEKDGLKYCFTLPYESFISEVYIGGKANSISTSASGSGTIIHFPADENLVFADSSRMVTCQQERLGFVETKKILEELKNTGKIDFEQSDLSIRPKPEHHLLFSRGDSTIGMTMIWYKNKLNITSFHYNGDDDCK
jgi:hypothetical protein